MATADKLNGARAFYTVDRNLTFVSVSENTLGLWGKERGDVVGKALLDLFPFVDGSPTHQGLLQALRTFTPIRLRDRSTYLNSAIEVEIYPVNDRLQVSFWPIAGEPSGTRRP